MALRKLYVVIDCANDEEKEMVQTCLQEISEMRVFNGNSFLNFYRLFNLNRDTFTKIISLVKEKGAKGLASIQGGFLLSKLRSK